MKRSKKRACYFYAALFSLCFFAGCTGSRGLYNQIFVPDQSLNGKLTAVPVTYSLLTYSESRARPLLIALHYSGGNGASYLDLWKKEAKKNGFMVLAPNINWAENVEEKVLLLIDDTIKKYPVMEGQIFLAGSSSGALLAERMMVRRPDFWRRAVYISYVGDGGEFKKKQEKQFPPMLFLHGDQDAVYSIEKVVKLTAELREEGHRVDLKRYLGKGHEHFAELAEDTFSWILKNQE